MTGLDAVSFFVVTGKHIKFVILPQRFSHSVQSALSWNKDVLDRPLGSLGSCSCCGISFIFLEFGVDPLGEFPLSLLIPPSVDSELPSSILALTALSSSWNIVQQLKIFLAHFLQADLDSSLAALQIPIPTLLSKSNNTILPAVDDFFSVNSRFLVALHNGTAPASRISSQR